MTRKNIPSGRSTSMQLAIGITAGVMVAALTGCGEQTQDDREMAEAAIQSNAEMSVAPETNAPREIEMVNPITGKRQDPAQNAPPPATTAGDAADRYNSYSDTAKQVTEANKEQADQVAPYFE